MSRRERQGLEESTRAPDVGIDLETEAGIEHRWTEVDGVRIHYRYSPGSGPNLLLLPGGMLDSSALTWKRVLEALPPRYRVFAPDIPGYGRSDAPDASYTTEYFIGFVEAFLERVGVRQVSVFGSSMSGAVAIGYALRRPERVGVLVLSGAYGLQDRMPLHEGAYLLSRIPRIDAAVRALLRLSPAVVRAALPVAVHHLSHIDDELVADTYAGVQGEQALKAFLRWMQSETEPHHVRTDFTPRLQQLSMPVLLLHGEHDWMAPIRYARAAAQRIPHAELHAFDSGHLVPREWPEQASGLIVDFLRRHLGE